MENRHWLVLYDIREERRLARVAKVVESYGSRVQKSVFEMHAPPSVVMGLKRRVEQVIDMEEDFILLFEVCERDWQKREFFGKNLEKEEDNASFVIL
mgnify:CR=1 FL=1